MKNIRNFAIIAHVDHGKSTLADRFLEICGIIKPGEHPQQFLDRHPISRERGITIKLAPVRMEYKGYILNLIDTPGHVDFSYEVERTLSCVEGVILLVDATCGIQAQTIAHAYKALEKNLVFICAVNKIDLPLAEIERTKNQIKSLIGEEEIFEISAKTGKNVEKLLNAVIEKIPSPKDGDNKKLQALIFDSYFDSYRGVIAFVRVFSGKIFPGMTIFLSQKKIKTEVLQVGIFTPDLKPKPNLSAGEIGYVITNLKEIQLVSVGDTLVDDLNTPSLSGYKKVKPMVFASIFPVDSNDFKSLKNALEKLSLNDASLTFESVYSQSLGGGFRCGFLGLLHAEIVKERLEREFGLDLVLTPPQVEYIEKDKKGIFLEPYAKMMIITPSRYLSSVLNLCQNHRANFVTMDNRDDFVFLTYEIPMAELMINFYDKLKTLTSGYASLDWEFLDYRPVSASYLELLINNKPVEEFSEIVIEEKAYSQAKLLVKKMRQIIPRQQFEVKIQARYKGKIIVSERIAPFRKDVTQKLYGGDRTRKDKLLEKQKKGKKYLKKIGKIEIPKDAFLKFFRR